MLLPILQTSLLALSFMTAGQSPKVDIGLFSLFKPEAVNVRIASGEGALLDSSVPGVARHIAPGDVVRIRVTGNRLNITVVDSSGNAAQSVNASVVRLVPQGSASLELAIPGKIRREVRGELSVFPARNTARPRLTIALSTGRESAVASVVAAELAGSKPTEAIKALAVTARTYMLFHSGRHADEGFDFCDTTHCQLYRGESDLSAQTASPAVATAVAATGGEYLSLSGKPIEGFYTAVCGGLSATPEMVWGGKTTSGYNYRRIACQWCEASRFFKWERSASVASVLAAISVATGYRLSPEARIDAQTGGSGNFVARVVISDLRRTELSADEFRSAIGRRLGWNTVLSPSFTIEKRGRVFVFGGRGFGSQVGLCEAGASAQAAAGRGYRDILKFYYPGAEIATEDKTRE
ncbi:MAG TPA: SpoIID/LytB domain-containing protein [Blastocatellia bacterium]|nr:SpoIID/LytB domain-containing protein [Blastocatellia bacterium]